MQHFKKSKGGHQPESLQRNNLQIENKRQQVFVILQDEKKFIGNSSQGFWVSLRKIKQLLHSTEYCYLQNNYHCQKGVKGGCGWGQGAAVRLRNIKQRFLLLVAPYPQSMPCARSKRGIIHRTGKRECCLGKIKTNLGLPLNMAYLVDQLYLP